MHDLGTNSVLLLEPLMILNLEVRKLKRIQKINMSLAYFADPDMRSALCVSLLEYCRIPKRHRNDATIIADLEPLLARFDWKIWDRILKLAIKHDDMVSDEGWETNADEDELKLFLLTMGIQLNDFPVTEYERTLYKYGSLKEFIREIRYVLGFRINHEFFMSVVGLQEELDFASSDIYNHICYFEVKMRKKVS